MVRSRSPSAVRGFPLAAAGVPGEGKRGGIAGTAGMLASDSRPKLVVQRSLGFWGRGDFEGQSLRGEGPLNG